MDGYDYAEAPSGGAEETASFQELQVSLPPPSVHPGDDEDYMQRDDKEEPPYLDIDSDDRPVLPKVCPFMTPIHLLTAFSLYGRVRCRLVFANSKMRYEAVLLCARRG